MIVRDLVRSDLAAVVRIDALHAGGAHRAYWRGIFEEFLGAGRRGRRVGLAAVEGERLVGYLLGEVRAFEFGSEACGWVFDVGVDAKRLRSGVATELLAEACRRFRDLGVERVRTMVRRTDIPVLSFFRSSGFAAGEFVQLELDLEALA